MLSLRSAALAFAPTAPVRAGGSDADPCFYGALRRGPAVPLFGGALLAALLHCPAAAASPQPGERVGPSHPTPAARTGTAAALLGGVMGLQGNPEDPDAWPAAAAGSGSSPVLSQERAGSDAATTPTPPAAVSSRLPAAAVRIQAPAGPTGLLQPDRSFQEPDPPPLRPGAPANAPAGDEATSRELVLDRRRRQLLVLENGTALRRFPVAVGMPGWETPVGRFRVLEKRVNPVWEHPATGLIIQPGPENPLGSRWIGFHRDCSGRSGFNGKEHLVVKGCVVAGFHGTPNRSSVGRAVSHGCVRLFDEDVRALFDLVQVGTAVTVLP